MYVPISSGQDGRPLPTRPDFVDDEDDVTLKRDLCFHKGCCCGVCCNRFDCLGLQRPIFRAGNTLTRESVALALKKKGCFVSGQKRWW